MNLFGYKFEKINPENYDDPSQLVSFVPPITDDGAAMISAGGSYGTYVDLDGTIRNEADLCTKYREMSMHPEVDIAIDDIVNEAIIQDSDVESVTIVLDRIKYSDAVKKEIIDEFDKILLLLDFNNMGYDIFKRWYVDGRLYFHAIVDQNDVNQGIQELRYVDPRKIRKVKEQVKKRSSKSPLAPLVNQTVNEYYFFNDKGLNSVANNQLGTMNSATSGLKIAKDSIVYIASGLLSQNNDMVLSYLHKAIKPLNQLRALEDASVIYKLSRAPDRRVFYIDIGNLPKMKAEQYLRDMMTKFKNKVVYDASTGEMRDDRKFMTMLEDFWLPRREGGRGTEVTTLNGSTSFNDMSDVEYFQRNLYRSLNVPTSRLQPETAFNMGRSTEISRDEIKFAKFIRRLRSKFSQLFIDILGKQLVLKGILSLEEWQEIENQVVFRYNQDNMFEELKEMEILTSRINAVKEIDPYIGKYYSNQYVMRTVLHLTEQEIDDMRKEIEQEQNNPILNPELAMQQQQSQQDSNQPQDDQQTDEQPVTDEQ